MNWELFNVGDDVSKVILELEANLQLLNNDDIVLGFVHLYFTALNEDLFAKGEYIKKHNKLTQKITKEHNNSKDDNRKTVLINRRNTIVANNRKKFKEYRIERFRIYKQSVFFRKEEKKLLQETRKGLAKIKIDFNCINLLKISAVEVVYAIQTKDFQLVEKLMQKLQKIIIPHLNNVQTYQGIDVLSKDGRKKLMEAFPTIIDFFDYFDKHLLHPLKDSKDYDFFFALAIRQTPLQKLEALLHFQKEQFKGDFTNFLKLVLLEFESLLNPSHIVILKEWIKEKPKEFISSIKWTDGKKKINFIKLVYALHASKTINNGKGTFEEVLNDFAKLVNLKLGANPISNISNEKHKRNADHNPFEFFENLQSAYQEYIEKENN